VEKKSLNMSFVIEMVRGSFEKIKPQFDEFAASFYENLFQTHPEIKPLFTDSDPVNQQKRLLNTLGLVVNNVYNPKPLEPVFNTLIGRQISYEEILEHYQPVKESLLLTFERYLQADWSPEVKQAWLDILPDTATLQLKSTDVDDVFTNNQQKIAVNSGEPAIEKSTIATFVLKVVDDLPTNHQEEIAVNSEKQAVIDPEIKEVQELETPKQISELESSELAVEVLVSSFEKVKPHADKFAASFYENLFEIHPEVKPLFGTADMKNQQKKLLNSLVLVLENLRNPEALEPVLKALGGRHIGYGVTAKYYRPVGEALLMTFEQYLQADWTPDVKKAWLNAYRAITALMLKGAKEESSPKVIETDKSSISAKPIQVKRKIRKTTDLAKNSVLETRIAEDDDDFLKEIIDDFTVKYQQFQTKISEQPFIELLKPIPQKLIDVFWKSPAWLVAIVFAVFFTVVIVTVDGDSFLGKVFGAADTISLVVALVLFVKEAPDRRKQFHYQAWSIIDAAQGAKVSYARILALQDLNEDSVSLRSLDAPGAKLVGINLSHADISKANLVESDLSNANLSYANLDNASLSQAKFTSANLSYAKLRFAGLSQANLSSANLNHANLICANLSHANLSGADLRDASLSGANLEGAYLTGANLKNAKVSDDELRKAFLEGAIMPDGSKYKSSESDR
jgi:uncharacterized protein YjbI with pentapeptide repeats/hemoglobin-like flavoprotein